MRESKLMTPAEDASFDSPSQDSTSRCLLDQEIRAMKYEIIDRPDEGEPIWKSKENGNRYTQSEVLKRIRDMQPQ